MPAAFSGASSLAIRLPIRESLSITLAMSCLPGNGVAGSGYRLHDLYVAGAAAQVAFDAAPDLCVRGVRILVEQVGRLHHHARGAESALHRPFVDESLFHRFGLPLRIQSLGGPGVAAGG